MHTARLLIEAGVDPLGSPDDDTSPIFALMAKPDATTIEILKLMLDRRPDLISTPHPSFPHYTILHLAVRQILEITNPLEPHYRREIVKFLIEQGAEVNAQDSAGYTCLNLALVCTHQHSPQPDIEMIELLVHHGANWLIPNVFNRTPRDNLFRNPLLNTWRTTPEMQSRLAPLLEISFWDRCINLFK